MVEVTIALGILGFAALSIFGLLPSAMLTLRDVAFETVAARAAADARADIQQVELAAQQPQVLHYSMEGFTVSGDDPDAVITAYRSISDETLPGATSGGGLRRVAVQVVHNPGQLPIPVDTDGWAQVPENFCVKTFRFHVRR